MSDHYMSSWTLFSNHGHVLLCLARDPESRLRDVATDVGITERAVQKIVRDLQDANMISVTKSGRRNQYKINNKQPLRHELEAHCSVGGLISFVKNSVQERTTEDHEKTLIPNPEPRQSEQVQHKESKPSKNLSTPVMEATSGKSGEEPAKKPVETSIEKQQGSLF